MPVEILISRFYRPEKDKKERKSEKMKKMTMLILLAVFLFALSDESLYHAKARVARETLQVDMKLKLLNKPAVKSIKSSDGDIIDCIDIYKQPAFDHPALRNHTIQMKPSFIIASETPSDKRETSQQFVSQTWQRSGNCPQGTIPIRRILREDLLRVTSLEQYGKKSPQIYLHQTTKTSQANDPVFINNTKVALAQQVNRSAALLVTVGYNYIGAKGDINLWNPHVASPDEYTTAQIWLKNGPSDGFESVEAGWVVNPKLYGDTQTRLFIYWTRDSYKSTGCFDLTCTGFVQTNPKVALGAALGPISSDGGPQYQFTVSINMDPDTSNWWLKLGDGVVVGYWPASLFSYLKHSAILVQWGGEVYSPNMWKRPHPQTAMGSGEFAATLHGSACYIKGVRIVDYSLALKYPQRVNAWADQAYCYSAYNYIEGYTVEPVFYFGGPGRNTLCP